MRSHDKAPMLSAKALVLKRDGRLLLNGGAQTIEVNDLCHELILRMDGRHRPDDLVAAIRAHTSADPASLHDALDRVIAMLEENGLLDPDSV